jgi:hypothetical protein
VRAPGSAVFPGSERTDMPKCKDDSPFGTIKAWSPELFDEGLLLEEAHYAGDHFRLTLIRSILVGHMYTGGFRRAPGKGPVFVPRMRHCTVTRSPSTLILFNCEGKIAEGRDQARYIHRDTLSRQRARQGWVDIGAIRREQVSHGSAIVIIPSLHICWATSTAADSPGFNRSVIGNRSDATGPDSVTQRQTNAVPQHPLALIVRPPSRPEVTTGPGSAHGLPRLRRAGHHGRRGCRPFGHTCTLF